MKLTTLVLFLFIHFQISFAQSKAVHTSQAILINNLKQWIKIDGENDQQPVLLFLHGGPGGSVMSYADRFTSDLQKEFVVVQWDQRETGKTKSLNSSVTALTVAQFESDAVGVITYLLERFHQQKIFLVGHSWGGFLALEVAAHHPELLTACVAASPMVYQMESEKIALTKMKELADQKKNAKAKKELEEIKIPFETGTQLYYHRKWLYELINQQKAPFSKTYVEDWATTWLALFNEACSVNFFEAAPEIKCPIYFFVGQKDFQTNFNLTKSYFEKVKAEKKELFWFSHSAHGLNLTESKKFQDIIIQIRNQK